MRWAEGTGAFFKIENVQRACVYAVAHSMQTVTPPVAIVRSLASVQVFCFVLCCVVWCGVVWCGVVWCGVVWCDYLGALGVQNDSMIAMT